MNSIRISEWHLTSENKATMEELIKAAIDPEVIFVSHHIAWRKSGEEVELSSAESFLFSHEILKKLFGEAWFEWGKKVFETPDIERLKFLGDNRAVWQKTHA